MQLASLYLFISANLRREKYLIVPFAFLLLLSLNILLNVCQPLVFLLSWLVISVFLNFFFVEFVRTLCISRIVIFCL